MNRRSAVTAGLLLLAAGVAVVAMVHGAGGLYWNWFYPWVLLPYALLFVVFCLTSNPSPARALAGAVAAVLVLLSSAWFYIDAMWLSTSSTSALVFVFTPAWLIVGGLLAWALAWCLLGMASRKGGNP